MLAIHARYRGRERRRAELVRRSAEALSRLDGVAGFELLGVEDIRSTVDDPETLANVVMALLSDGSWAIGIGVDTAEWAEDAATVALGAGGRAGVVKARVRSPHAGTLGEDISAAFLLMSHVLAKRTVEGREATSLVRSGLNQNEAAAELGISKQAMSQRLQAAGWQAEQAGWKLVVNLLTLAGQTR
ncbi:MarR family transcriptional regulator [Corynebacterium guangdongense]|uniref:DNA-binding protein n=1 Tax=Corynebacterium guangdongense TaxID=1783348 RepID=A0ABU1ZWQ2_9CORY|nr:MarR family transcriptional regulator [Corynebacterium guangdongense]MDR7329359.1 hypothetical protein [Corynebacterium guangdongense]WJZ17924.1 hypothetical protein CGUA_06775 [Corynebacterium guangdongense]